jgi:AbrB family transcriptional regulator (stage V sporulation protein T)
MNATGITRRIDDLGRVVIPKEIRAALKVKDGDPIEFYSGPDGFIGFRKFLPFGENHEQAHQICVSASKATGKTVIITDTNSIVSVGEWHEKLNGTLISEELRTVIKMKEPYRHKDDVSLGLTHEVRFGIDIGCVIPIIVNDNAVGCIAALNPDDAAVDEKESMVLSAFADFMSYNWNGK